MRPPGYPLPELPLWTQLGAQWFCKVLGGAQILACVHYIGPAPLDLANQYCLQALICRQGGLPLEYSRYIKHDRQTFTHL